MKPILFNTEMVKAILDGRKTVTRRVIKSQLSDDDIIYKNQFGKWYISPDDDCYGETEIKPPYLPGDILYVRETWCQTAKNIFWYRADSKVQNLLWRPSIHMPKEAARIFLRVKDLRVERLQEITDKDAKREGVFAISNMSGVMHVLNFIKIWNSTIKKSNIDKYGWDANPWVWVIEFERISKSNALEEV